MSLIEDRIRNYRNYLDDFEPEAGHFERFDRKLDALEKPRLQLVYKVAAFLVVLIGTTLFIYFWRHSPLGPSVAELQELQNLEVYYAGIEVSKIQKIETLATDDSEASTLRELAADELEELKQNEKLLKMEYNQYPDQRILDAIVNNYLLMAEVLDNIFNNMKDVKKNIN